MQRIVVITYFVVWVKSIPSQLHSEFASDDYLYNNCDYRKSRDINAKSILHFRASSIRELSIKPLTLVKATVSVPIYQGLALYEAFNVFSVINSINGCTDIATDHVWPIHYVLLYNVKL